MLSFRALSEKKTKIKINPKQSEITEMENNHGEDCDCMKCEKKRRKEGGEKEVATEAKYYDPMEDDTFDHDEAEATRGQSGKNKSITIKKKTKKTTKEETAYVSQEEVSEESNQSIAETETLLTFGQFCEGMTMKGFKANRKKNERRAASADAEKRGHVGKEWHNTGRKYSADDAKSNRAKLSDDERAARHRAAVDPDDDRDENTYSADKTKNPKKLRKQAAMGEEKTILDEMPYQVYGSPDGKKEKKIGKPVKSGKYADARAAELEDTHRATGGKYRAQKEEVELEEGRSEDAQVSLAKVKARQKVLDAHEKKTGKKLDIAKTPEHKAHKKEFPGAKRTGKKVPGAKETPAETQRRQTNRQVSRVVKHGYTSKEKKEVESMAKHTSPRD